MSQPLIYRAKPYTLIFFLLICGGFSWFALHGITANWGVPAFSTAYTSTRYGNVSVLEDNIIDWASLVFFGGGGLFTFGKCLPRFLWGHFQVLNVNEAGIATPMVTHNFHRIPWRNIAKLSHHEDILVVELVDSHQDWAPKNRHRDAAVSQNGNILYITIYQYVPWTGCDNDQFTRDLEQLSRKYLQD